jgi:hypothetical protein
MQFHVQRHRVYFYAQLEKKIPGIFQRNLQDQFFTQYKEGRGTTTFEKPVNCCLGT